MNNNLATLCYISEQTSFVEDYKDFGYKVHDKGNRFYLTFNGTLQSFGVQNRNRRTYEAANIMSCINNDEFIQSMLRQQSWVGEIDHPTAVHAGDTLSQERISKPDFKYSSHYIRKPWLEGNLLRSPIQTDSSNEYGMNMAIKIVDGKIVPAFSARSFGELQNKMGNPVVYVRRLITYDWVPFPSHPEALADIKPGVLQESVDAFEKQSGGKIIQFTELARMVANDSKETEWLCESFGLSIDSIIGLNSTADSIIINENKNIYSQPITDAFIRNKARNGLSDFLGRGI